MSPPRVWRWISFAGGLVLILAGGLGVTQVLTAPGGQDEAAWLGGWRLAAGIAVLLGAWWMGNRRRAGGVVVLAFGVGEIAALTFALLFTAAFPLTAPPSGMPCSLFPVGGPAGFTAWLFGSAERVGIWPCGAGLFAV